MPFVQPLSSPKVMSRTNLLLQIRERRVRSESEESGSDGEQSETPSRHELRDLRSSALVSGTARAAFRSTLDAVLARAPSRVTPEPQPTPDVARSIRAGMPSLWRASRRIAPPPAADPDEAAYRASSLSSEIDHLVENSVVQALLESAFRSELERVVSRRASEAMSRIAPPRSSQPRPAPAPGGHAVPRGIRSPPAPPQHQPQPAPSAHSRGSPGSHHEIEALSRQVANLERMVAASFELQLSVQRIVQQEVAAALSLSRHAPAYGGAASTDDTEPSVAHVNGKEDATDPASSAGTVARRPGLCILCCDREVNCAFNGCGHMCYCMQVGAEFVRAAAPARKLHRAPHAWLLTQTIPAHRGKPPDMSPLAALAVSSVHTSHTLEPKLLARCAAPPFGRCYTCTRIGWSCSRKTLDLKCVTNFTLTVRV